MSTVTRKHGSKSVTIEAGSLPVDAVGKAAGKTNNGAGGGVYDEAKLVRFVQQYGLDVLGSLQASASNAALRRDAIEMDRWSLLSREFRGLMDPATGAAGTGTKAMGRAAGAGP
jgi:hypothetical protein